MKKKQKNVNTKRKSRIIVKLMVPVIVMGVIGLFSSYIGYGGISDNQESSEAITGVGISNIIALDEINGNLQRIMKDVLIYTANEDADLRAEMAEDIDLMFSKNERWTGDLMTNKETLPEETQDDIDAIASYTDTLAKEVKEVLAVADTNPKEAIKLSNEYMASWNANVGDLVDKIVAANDEHIAEKTKSQQFVFHMTLKISLVCVTVLIISFLYTLITAYRSIVKPIHRQQQELNEIITEIREGRGDLTKRVTVSSNDEIGASCAGINEFIETLQSIMSKIIANSKVLDGVVGSVVENVADSNDNAHDVSAIMEELAATMEEVSATTNNVSQNTENVSERVNGFSAQTIEITNYALDMKKRADDLEKNVRENMEHTTSVIGGFVEELNYALEESKSVEQVEVLTNEILSISSQTNLLALNASIEAAELVKQEKDLQLLLMKFVS